MSENEFLLKQISYTETVQVPDTAIRVKVSRTRTSEGACTFFLKVGSEKRIEISNHCDSYGDEYTAVVKAIITTLTKALDDPCSLPRT